MPQQNAYADVDQVHTFQVRPRDDMDERGTNSQIVGPSRLNTASGHELHGTVAIRSQIRVRALHLPRLEHCGPSCP